MARIRIKESYLLILCIFTVCSCVKQVTLDFKDYQSNLVVNSLLVPDSILSVHLSYSSPADGPDIFPDVSGAKVTLSEGTRTTGLAYRGKGVYSADEYPQSGKTYRLDVKMKMDASILSSTRIPSRPDITITPRPTEKEVQVNITDNPDETNYYWVGQKSYSLSSAMMYYETYIYSDFLLFDDFNRTRNSDPFYDKRFSFHFYARLPDYQFNGQSVSFILPHHWSDPDTDGIIRYMSYVYIINADEHLDRYMKSAVIQYDLGVVGDMPVFHTPVSMYSNIENGKGIFGSYTISQFDITTP